MKKSSSKRWLQEHFSDPYVRRARQDGFRARSVYKLMDIDQQFRLIKSHMQVVDLGAAPGSWTEYLATAVGRGGKVFALDILPMHGIAGVEFMQGDFFKDEVARALRETIGVGKIDVVLSDMAPNLSGIKHVDQMKSFELAQRALYFAMGVLKNRGNFLIKMFHGEELQNYKELLKKYFCEIKIIKPEASRARSSEIFLLARDFRDCLSSHCNIK